MSLNFELLFQVFFKHEFFNSGNLETITVSPSAATKKIFKDYDLIFRCKKDSFSIFYANIFAFENITREELLAQKLEFNFTIQCNDSNVFGYTGNLPKELENKMLLFQYPNTSLKPEILHQNEYVSDKDFIDFRYFEFSYFSRPFGHLKIVLDSEMPTDNFIQFASQSLYWRYVIRTPHLLVYENLMIANKTKTIFFEGPSSIILPNGDVAISFVSPEPISQKQTQDLKWQLLEQFQIEKKSGKILLPTLPQPNHNSISFLGDKNKIKGDIRILDIII